MKQKRHKKRTGFRIERSELNPQLVFETLLGKRNRKTYAQALGIAAHPGRPAQNPFLIVGGNGNGKTHLLHAIGNKASSQFSPARVLLFDIDKLWIALLAALGNGERLDFEAFVARYDFILIDDFQDLAGRPAIQEMALNLLNACIMKRRQVVIACRSHPSEIEEMNMELVQRLLSGQVVVLRPQGLQILTRIALRELKNTKVSAKRQVARSIANYSHGNIRFLERNVMNVLACSCLTGREITPAMVKDVLERQD